MIFCCLLPIICHIATWQSSHKLSTCTNLLSVLLVSYLLMVWTRMLTCAFSVLALAFASTQVHRPPQRVLPSCDLNLRRRHVCAGPLGVPAPDHVADCNSDALPHGPVAARSDDCVPCARGARRLHRAEPAFAARIGAAARDSALAVRASPESAKPLSRRRAQRAPCSQRSSAQSWTFASLASCARASRRGTNSCVSGLQITSNTCKCTNIVP